MPLFSWYTKPEEDSEDSLHISPTQWTENVEWMEQIWMDNHLCKWGSLKSGQTKSQYFSSLNQPYLHQSYSPVVSFSHFVPSVDLVLATNEDKEQVDKERHLLGKEPIDKSAAQGSVPGFNFTRYAGCKTLQSDINHLKPVVHVFGHQHRNRDRVIDGIRYVSHCLGNPKEQNDGWVWGIAQWKGPKQIWPQVDAPS